MRKGGAVLFALADTLAAHELGGFKIGVGFALRKCRMCLATAQQMSTRVRIIVYVFMSMIILNYSMRPSVLYNIPEGELPVYCINARILMLCVSYYNDPFPNYAWRQLCNKCMLPLFSLTNE